MTTETSSPASQALTEEECEIRRWLRRLDNTGSTWSHARVAEELKQAVEYVGWLLNRLTSQASPPTAHPTGQVTREEIARIMYAADPYMLCGKVYDYAEIATFSKGIEGRLLRYADAILSLLRSRGLITGDGVK